MANLTKAKKILTNLIEHLKTYTANPATVDKELNAIRSTMDEVTVLKATSKHTRNKDNDPRFAELDTLEQAVKSSVSNLEKYKAEQTKLAAEQQAKLAAEQQAKLAAEQQAKLAAEQQAKLAAEQQAKLAAEQQAKLAAEQQAKLAAEQQAKIIAELQAKITAELQAKIAAELQAKIATELEARIAAELQAKLAAEQQAKLAAEQQAKLAAEQQAKLVAEQQAKLATEQQAKLATEQQAKLATEQQAKLAAELHAKISAELQTQISTELATKIAAELQTRLSTDQQAQTTTQLPVVENKKPATKEEDTFSLEVTKLEALLEQKHPVELDASLNQLIAQVKKLKAEARVDEQSLLTVLSATYLRLTGQLKAEQYEELASKVQGKPSLGLKILGGLMLSVSVTIAALGLVFFPSLCALATTAITALGLSLNSTAVAATTIGLGSSAVAAGSIGFFAKSRQSGLAQQVSELNYSIKVNPFTFAANS